MSSIAFNQLIKVTYPNGLIGAPGVQVPEDHIITISVVRDRWKDKSQEWRDNFYSQLEENRVAYSDYGGKYEVLNEFEPIGAFSGGVISEHEDLS